MLCRELTKTHEEIRRGTLGELAAGVAGEAGGEASGPVLGEITLVVAGAAGGRRRRRTAAEAAAEVARREQAGAEPRGTRSPRWPPRRGLRRREVYNAVVAARSACAAVAA